MSRYAVLFRDRTDPPRMRMPAPFGYRELWISGFAMRDEQVRRAQVDHAISDARFHLLTLEPAPGRFPLTPKDLGRPRIRFRRASPMPGEAPIYVLTVVVYPKGALP